MNSEKSLEELRKIYWDARCKRKIGKESFGCRNYVQEEDLIDASLEAIASHIRDTEVKSIQHELYRHQQMMIEMEARHQEELKQLIEKIQRLTTLLDEQFGTPCEQIRHEQEMVSSSLIAQAWLDNELAEGHVLNLTARIHAEYQSTKEKNGLK